MSLSLLSQLAPKRLKARHRELIRQYGLTRFVHAAVRHQVATRQERRFSPLEDWFWRGRSRPNVDPPNEEFLAELLLDMYHYVFRLTGLPPLSRDIYFGWFPITSVNAHIRNEGDAGYLALVHSGLYGLVHDCIATVVLSAPAQTEDGQTRPPPLTQERASEIVGQALKAFLDFKTTSWFPRFRELSEMQNFSVLMLSALQFVVVHEYMHARCGHLESKPVRDILTIFRRKVPVNAKSIEQEWEADTEAVGWFIGRCKLLNEKHMDGRGIALLVAGAMAVLMIIGWVEVLRPPRRATHPPGRERLAVAERRFADALGETRWYQLAWNFMSHLESLGTMAGAVREPLFSIGPQAPS